MDQIERKLTEQKRKLDQLTVPDDLETRLEKSLYSVPKRKSRSYHTLSKVLIAVIIMLTFLAGYNHNALAYYGKKILGFDDFYGTVFQLNEDEKGQVIEKTVELEDGLYFTVNGIMTDANQLVMFYTFYAPEGLDQFDGASQYWMSSISGFMTNASAHGGGGQYSDDGTTLKGLYNFDPINPLAKKLTLHIWEDDGAREITFSHDPNKAMKASIDTPIGQTVELDKGSITFDSIIASPTMTLLKGSIDVEGYDDFMDTFRGIKLVADDVQVGKGGRLSTTTEDGKTTFDIHFNTLPDELDTLQVFVDNFIGYKENKGTINLTSLSDQPIDFHGEEVIITDVKQTGEEIEISILTDKDIVLEGLGIEASGVHTKVEEMVMAVPKVNDKVERTYSFKTKDIPDTLTINGLFYMKPYEKVVDIPVK